MEVLKAGPCLRAQDNAEGDGLGIFPEEKEKPRPAQEPKPWNMQVYPVRKSGLRPRWRRLQGLAQRQRHPPQSLAQICY